MNDKEFLSVLEEGLGKPKVPVLSFREFIPKAWKIIEPATNFVGNWHIDALSDHLEAVAERKIRKLLITIPPRKGKSRIASIFWTTWVWTRFPGEQFLCSSYSGDLSIEHNIYARRIIQSDWYQKNWGKLFRLVGDQNRKGYFQNDHSGYRMATSVGGVGTGFGGSVILVDDPHNVKEAPSKAKREAVIKWWTQAMSTRLNNPKTGVMVVIQQRCHKNDLAGFLIEQDDWEHLNMPEEYDPNRAFVTSIGWKDPREVRGELLWPSIYGRDELKDIKKTLGTYGWASQYQQSPVLPSGGIINASWWKYWDEADLPKDATGKIVFDFVAQSWDLAFKSTEASDYVVGQVWGVKGSDRFLLDQVRDKLSFSQTLDAVSKFSDKYKTHAIYIEDKANGPAVISILRKELIGVIPIDPQGDKVSRVMSISPQIEAGNVYLPRKAYWVDDFLEEFASATPEGGGEYWDQIDATSQALLKLTRNVRSLTWGRGAEKKKDENSGGVSIGKRFITVGDRYGRR